MPEEHDLHIRLTDELFQALRKIASDDRRSVTAQVAKILEEYIQRGAGK